MIDPPLEHKDGKIDPYEYWLHMFYKCDFHLLYFSVHNSFKKISFYIIIDVFVTKDSYTHCLVLTDAFFHLLLWVVHQCMNQSIMDFQGISTSSYSFNK